MMNYEQGLDNLAVALKRAGLEVNSEAYLDFSGWRSMLLDSIERERRAAGLGPLEQERRQPILRNLDRLALQVTDRSFLDWCITNSIVAESASSNPAQGEVNFELEAQTWYVRDLPDTEEIGWDKSRPFADEIDAALFTINMEEHKAVMRLMEAYPGCAKVLRMYRGTGTHYLGRFGAHRVTLTMARMGSIEPNTIRTIASDAFRFWRPRALIMVGVAFGKDPRKQRLGDVLVATQIISYEPGRINPDRFVSRGAHTPVNPTLLNRFENAPGWTFQRPDGSPCQLIAGPVLSGEKLIDSLMFKQQLFDTFPKAVGGEMEGAGLAAVAVERSIPWILVKGICDWGDGSKSDKYQPLAAAAAATLVHTVLSQNTVLASFPKPSRITDE